MPDPRNSGFFGDWGVAKLIHMIPSIEKLSTAEKLALLELLCESLAEIPQDVSLSESQRRLIRDRLQEYRRNPAPGKPIEQALDEIRAGRQ